MKLVGFVMTGRDLFATRLFWVSQSGFKESDVTGGRAGQRGLSRVQEIEKHIHYSRSKGSDENNEGDISDQ